MLAVLAFPLAACGSLPIAPSDLEAARARLTPGAERRCAALGFGPSTTPPIAACVESVVLEGIESRWGWRRMDASGLDIWGTERVEAISRCIASGMTPSDARMPGCMEAQFALVRRDNRVRAEQAAAAAAPVVCNRVGTSTVCF